MNYIIIILLFSDVRYLLIYQNTDIFIQYRDTILVFGCIDTLEYKPGFSNLPDFILKAIITS